MYKSMAISLTMRVTLVSKGDVYTVFQKKHVTTFSMVSWSRTVRLQSFFGTLITKSIGHQQVFLVSHLTYLLQLLYLGKLTRH